MMKNILLFTFCVLSIWACNPATEKKTLEDTSSQETSSTTVTTNPKKEEAGEKHSAADSKVSDNQQLLGSYVGMFLATKIKKGSKGTWANKINISLDKIEGNKVEGHSVVAGNDRLFSGTIEARDATFYVEVKEPGDNKYDGVFSFEINPSKKEVKGLWDANDKKLAVSQRKFKLKKRVFKYNPALKFFIGYDGEHETYGGLYDTYDEETGKGERLTSDAEKYNASTQELKKEDVENLHKGDLEAIRNAIYARHGYSFKNRRMRYIFNQVDWYMPMSTDIRSQLTDLEKKNIDLLKRYEKHADKYYDSFGR